MLYAYIDESYRAGEIYLVGAWVLDRRQVDLVTFGLDEIARKTNSCHPEIPADIEFHGQNMFQRSEDWSVVRDRPAVAYAVYRRALSRCVRTGGRWFVAGVRRPDRLAARYVDPWPAHSVALQYVLELVDDYAREIGEQVTVIADTVENQRMHESHIRVFQDRGRTAGWKPRTLAQIEREFQWVDSRDHRALQACDMLTYVYLRKRYLANAHRRTVHEIGRLRDIAKPALHADKIWTP